MAQIPPLKSFIFSRGPDFCNLELSNSRGSRGPTWRQATLLEDIAFYSIGYSVLRRQSCILLQCILPITQLGWETHPKNKSTPKSFNVLAGYGVGGDSTIIVFFFK